MKWVKRILKQDQSLIFPKNFFSHFQNSQFLIYYGQVALSSTRENNVMAPLVRTVSNLKIQCTGRKRGIGMGQNLKLDFCYNFIYFFQNL